MQKKKILGAALFFAMFASAATVAAETYTGDRAMPAALCEQFGNMTPYSAGLYAPYGGEVYCGLPLDADLGTLDEVFIEVSDNVSACTLRNQGSIYNPNSTVHLGSTDQIKWTTNRSAGNVNWVIICNVPVNGSVYRYYVDQD